ncbi:MAG: TonB-dependent receptor plug domain-containing protein [Gemmatimonadaceae bacterium]
MFRFPAIAALVIAASTVLRAQAPDTVRLQRVVVTATKVDSRIGSRIASVSVLDGSQLRARGVRDVAEALRAVPGAAVVRSGSFGAQTSLFLRGGESDYVRVLVDGVPVNDPGGAVDLTFYTLNNVDRIEVVRGPASVLYGSDAVTGVIQIFTRQAGNGGTLDGDVNTGTYGTRAFDFSLGAGSRALYGTAGLARRSSDGILAFNNSYENDVLSASSGFATAQGTRVALSARQQRDEYHYPTDGAGRVSDRNAFRRDRRSVLAADAAQSVGARVSTGLTLSVLEGRPRTDDAADSPADTSGFYAYRSAGSVRRRVADARVNVLLPGRAIATLGHEWQREAQRGRDSSNFDSAPNAFSAERTTRASYVQIVGEAGALSYTIGGRYDDNDVFGVFRTARLGMALRVTGSTTLRTSAGSAFKGPTFLEQFNTAFTVGNPALRPERSRSVEVAAEQELAGGASRVTVTWFGQRFRDLIQYSFKDPATPNFFNVAAAAASGLELEGEARAGSSTRIGAALTLLRTRVDDAGFDRGAGATFVRGQRLLRRPSVSGSLSASTSLTTRLSADARLLHVGSRDDRDFSGFPAKPVVLESYQRLDVGVTYRFLERGAHAPSVAAFARAENVLGSGYEEIANFAAPGRTLTLGLRLAYQR